MTTKARKLVVALACRNAGSRLYAKPLQNLDISTGATILDVLLDALGTLPMIDEVVLGIAEGIENDSYEKVAREKGLRFVRGDEKDVLGRLIACADLAEATDIFRVTSESPFPHLEAVAEAWQKYCDQELDAYFYDGIVDGCGFEFLSLAALRTSHAKGEDRHRSEFCTLFIRENSAAFRTLRAKAPGSLQRTDLRLTVDYPEDLVVCRAVYQALRHEAPRISVAHAVQFLDENPELKQLVAPFTEAGYETMYVWSNEANAQ